MLALVRGWDRLFDPLSPHLRFFSRRSLARAARTSWASTAGCSSAGAARCWRSRPADRARAPGHQLRRRAGHPARRCTSSAWPRRCGRPARWSWWRRAGTRGRRAGASQPAAERLQRRCATRRGFTSGCRGPPGRPGRTWSTTRCPALTRDRASRRWSPCTTWPSQARPEGYGRIWRRLAARQYRRAVRAARGGDLRVRGHRRGCGRPARRPARAAGGGPSRAGAEAARRRDGASPPDHFLYVGDAEPRKNVPGLLEAYAAYRAGAERPLDLVLAGQLRAAGGRRRRARRGRIPTRGAWPSCSRRRAALVHPSRHEGFGLTVLEAMAAGVPVVAVSGAGVREVAGDAALLVEPGGARRRAGPDLAGRRAAPAAGARRARAGQPPSAGRSRPGGTWLRLYAGAPDSGTSPMNVAILGTRGIPASYSGFETAVEQITSRLTARGHRVVVYCRPHVVDPAITRVEGRRARASPHGAQQVPGHVRAHAALERARRAHGSSPTSRSSSSPATARCAWSPGSPGSRP